MASIAFPITITEHYKYVLLSATVSTILGSYHTHVTGNLRVAAAAVSFPNAYAAAAEASTSPKKYRFDCAQKVHANFTENHASFICLILITGLKFPLLSAGLGATWSIARLLYLLGYTRKENAEDGKGCHWGTWWAGPHMILMGLAVAPSLMII